MHKRFNTTGLCYPNEHYMVNIEERLNEIKFLVDQGLSPFVREGRLDMEQILERKRKI